MIEPQADRMRMWESPRPDWACAVAAVAAPAAPAPSELAARETIRPQGDRRRSPQGRALPAANLNEVAHAGWSGVVTPMLPDSEMSENVVD